MRWYEQEERYLHVLHDICVQLSKEYMQLYIISHKFQTKLRLPSIILSSLSGVASFGSSSFGNSIQRYISIGVGLVNVGIAIVQTYESYLKIGDIVSKALTCSTAFKKLADDIYCETFIPVENRNSNGITFLRDCFAKYQTIIDQAPPLEFHGKVFSDSLKKAQSIMETINADIRSNVSVTAEDPPPVRDDPSIDIGGVVRTAVSILQPPKTPAAP
jgi:hypothetical protein